MNGRRSKSSSLPNTAAEDEAHWTREFLYAILDNVPSMITVVNADDLTYAFVNRALEEQYGLSRNDMVGKTAHELFPKEMADGIAARDKQLIEANRELFFEVRTQMTAKGQRFMTSRRVPVRGENGELRYIVSVIEDVTERQRAQHDIAHMARHDPLTDLPNRAAFNEKLAAVFEHAETSGAAFAVLCVDLDRFKDVNDVFGHAVGDALLCEVAQRLRVAAGSAFLARLGGDEFIVIEPIGPQPSTSKATAERLLRSVTTDIEIRAQQLRIGLSVGGAIYPADGKDAATLLANADAALYRAKAEGRFRRRAQRIDSALPAAGACGRRDHRL
jgi:diguanylate cyclase (GGDEF)-like protein/PAS domain S-box-containing protein